MPVVVASCVLHRMHFCADQKQKIYKQKIFCQILTNFSYDVLRPDLYPCEPIEKATGKLCKYNYMVLTKLRATISSQMRSYKGDELRSVLSRCLQ